MDTGIDEHILIKIESLVERMRREGHMQPDTLVELLDTIKPFSREYDVSVVLRLLPRSVSTPAHEFVLDKNPGLRAELELEMDLNKHRVILFTNRCDVLTMGIRARMQSSKYK